MSERSTSAPGHIAAAISLPVLCRDTGKPWGLSVGDVSCQGLAEARRGGRRTYLTDGSQCTDQWGSSVFQCGIAVATMVPVAKAGKVLYRAADNGYDAAKAAARSRRAKNSRPCLLNSFTGATPVLMADGTTKPIKNIKLGDKVTATDPETGETGPRRVVDLIQHGGIHIMVAIRLADGSTIRATDEHPFWDADSATWINAIDLRPGDQLTTADGELILVDEVRTRQQNLTAYNLTVTDLHTYHAGTTPILVHNDDCAANAVRPSVTDARLGRALADDFRGGPNPIGDGSALDAARHTVDTGRLVGGSTHLEKAVEMRDRYARVLRRGGLNSADEAVAQGRYDAYSSFVIENDLDAMMRARGLR